MKRFALASAVLTLASAAYGQSRAVVSRIDGSFEGWKGDTIVKLANGQFWKQVGYSYEYHYAYRPVVHIYLAGDGFVMHVDGTSRAVPVARLEASVSRIDGSFEGWSGDTIVKLTNGQIWQQATYSFEYRYAYRPTVIVYEVGRGYAMYVDGTSKPVRVTRLK